MVSAAENALLTQVGRGTPCGELLRRYWMPLCPAAELCERSPKRRVRILGDFPAQDLMAWETQGPVFDRTTELLGMSDRGVVLWRKLLMEQIEAVQAGREPAGVIRDARLNDRIAIKMSGGQARVAREVEPAEPAE